MYFSQEFENTRHDNKTQHTEYTTVIQIYKISHVRYFMENSFYFLALNSEMTTSKL